MISSRIANRLWHLDGIRHHRRFSKAVANPESAQITHLLRLLRRQASTEFGRAHHFEQIRSVAEFQDAVPLSEYADYEGAIDKIARGGTEILTRDSVSHFVPTSGSTSARKLIPWTAGLQRELNRAIGAWVSDLFSQSPDLRNGRAYWSVSPAVSEEQDPTSKVRIGFDDDTNYLGGIGSKVVGTIMAVPSAVRHIEDTDAFRYTTLLHLAAARDLRLVSVWHPTFLALLLDSFAEHYDAVIDTIRTGVLNPPAPLPEGLFRKLQASFRPDPERARELSALDPARPDTIWPQLQLLSAWGDVESPGQLDLARRFPKARFQPKGILATEAFVTIPYAGHSPLAVTSHFFEFLDETGTAHLAHELDAGKRYEVVVTTSGGLYRYRLRDQVDVTGFLHRTPCLRFAGRAGRVSDLRGEKLDPQFVGDVIARHTKAFSDSIRFQLLVADPASQPAGYTLVLVADPVPPLCRLAAALDAELCENPHYRLCRFLGQLHPLRARAVAPESIDAYFAWRTARGQKLGNIKPAVIDAGPGLLQCFSPSTSSKAEASAL